MNKLRHLGIFVEDMDSMAAFYGSLFSMETVYDERERGQYLESLTGLLGADFQIRKLAAKDGFIIELLKLNTKVDWGSRGGELYSPGFSHIAVTVDNIEEVLESLERLGASFVSQPLQSPFGNVKVCFCRDLEGNFLEIVEDLRAVAGREA